MINEKIIIANWKMNLLPNEEKALLASYLTLHTTKKIIIAPSFLSIQEISKTTNNHQNFFTCGQTCSSYENGAHTGDVSAAQLASLNVRFCLVGHLERKNFCNENENTITEQTTQLLKKKITPIICLENPSQQAALINKIASLAKEFPPTNICFAFEPSGAIGSGETPELKEIESEVFALKKTLTAAEITQFMIFYGGSVSAENAHQIANLEGINGLLVGGKSLNFQEFKKIVN